MSVTDSEETEIEKKKANYERAVSRLNDLPTIPGTLLRIWRLVDSPYCSASDLGKVIAMDQALSAKILRLVNSPYYGFWQKINSAQRAITVLGFDTIKSVSVCASVVTALMPKGKRNTLDLSALWRHSISTGVIAKLLSERSALCDKDTAFSGGVLHDVGKFVMSLCISETYVEVIDLARRNKMYVRDAEEAVLGVDHTHFGMLLARKWAFPEPLLESITKHHDEERSRSTDIPGIISLADNLARSLDHGASGDYKQIEPDIEGLSRFRIDTEAADSFIELARRQISDAQEFMNLI